LRFRVLIRDIRVIRGSDKNSNFPRYIATDFLQYLCERKNKRMKRIIYSTFAVFTLACFALAQQAPDSVSIRVITTFDYPGTGNLTNPQKINDTNDIVGGYVDSSGVGRGFVRFSDGTFSAPIVDPNETCNNTLASGINNSRLICGYYLSAPCGFYSTGFFLMGHNFSDFVAFGSQRITLGGVNNVGDFAGSYFTGRITTNGFVSIGGIITSFLVPGSDFTIAYQLNSSNQLEGYYALGSLIHAYWRDADGTLHFPIDPPGSTGTSLFGNNDSNWMVGSYVDSAGTTHGLFFVPPNRFLTFDYPGSTFTSLNGINAQGFICGYYTDASGIDHGILARVRGVPSANEGQRIGN